MSVLTQAETQQVERPIASKLRERVVATSNKRGVPILSRREWRALWSQDCGGAGILFPTWPSSMVLVGALALGWVAYLVNAGLILGAIRKSGEAALNAEKAAFRLFSSRGVYRTRDQSGVLILLAENERQVVILGDEGIDRVLPVGSWETYVKH